MSLLVTWNSTGYLVPTTGETGWASVVTSLLNDLGSNGTPKGAAAIIGGTINNTIIGNATPAAGTFSTLTATNSTITSLTATNATVPTLAFGNSSTNAASTAFVQNAIITGDIGRNKLHNPLFNIAQRGAGPFTTNGVYTLDRWQMSLATDTMSVSQIALSDSARTQIGDEEANVAFQNVFTSAGAAGSFNQVVQKVENVRRLANKTITVSFYAQAASGTPKLGASIVQNFGTGGSPSTAVAGTGTSVTLSTTWTRYSITLVIPSISGKTLGTNSDHFTQLSIWFSAGTTFAAQSGTVGAQSNTVNLWGVQLEVDSQANPLEKPDPQIDLSNCQRFAQVLRLSLQTSAAAFAGISVPFPVPMRATPNATNQAVGTATSAVLQLEAAIDNASVFFQISATVASGSVTNRINLYSADL